MEAVYQNLHLRDPIDPHRFSHAQIGLETTYIWIKLFSTNEQAIISRYLNVALDTASKVHVLQTSDVTAKDLFC